MQPVNLLETHVSEPHPPPGFGGVTPGTMVEQNDEFASRSAESAFRAPQIESLDPLFRGRRPAGLAFGTSGLRGLVKDITDLEAYINTRGFLEYALESRGIVPGQEVSISSDLRPSSDSPERSILRAVAKAIVDSGLQVDHIGRLPTPALTHHAMSLGRASIMVTGSHIPFDRNGIKFNLVTGEVLKSDEAAILRAVQRVRLREYARPEADSPFAENGMFKHGQDHPLPSVNPRAEREYSRRYQDFFDDHALDGLRVILFQHSAVGRDLLKELLASLGAEVFAVGRSESFVPVDTEAISDDMVKSLQHFVDETRQRHGQFDAIVSTDGDSDRPLLAGITPEGKVKFFSGDLLGIVTADFLNVDAVAVPISANDAVDCWAAARGVHVVKTRIGSPYVIKAMQETRDHGYGRVAGWEANGGFLTATDFPRKGRALTALPTRDAALPLLAALCAANERRVSLTELFARLPGRFGKSGLLDGVTGECAQALLARFAPAKVNLSDVVFTGTFVSLRLGDGRVEPADADTACLQQARRRELERILTPECGFGHLVRINMLDGLRLWFNSGDVVHIRPSGNAPQLRVYAVADSEARASEIVALALREPDGFLRRITAETLKQGSDPEFVEKVGRNIRLTSQLIARGDTPGLIGTVSGSTSARRFWQNSLDRARKSFNVAAAVSFAEDLPTNQALGLLLLWQRLKPYLRDDRGALVAFVFGEGTRATPFTETDGGQKAAVATFVPESAGSGVRFLSMVELGLRFFVPVQQFLRRSGFAGIVIKWGDEVQIPARDLSGSDPLFTNADIVRFVSLREMNADLARHKDWVGVNESGHITAFIPRRPLEEMELLVSSGLLQRRQGKLWGGINLGSIAVSQGLLDCLLEEFEGEVNDSNARREDRPALDPEFFTAITVAALEDPAQRAAEWERSTAKCPEVNKLNSRFPDLMLRLRRVIRNLEGREGRRLKMVAMDFGDQYWGDIGQHSEIYDFYMALNRPGPDGDIARAIAGLAAQRDERGNLIVNSVVAAGVEVSNSVLINATLSGQGVVERSILIGTRATNVEIRDGFDVMSTVVDLRVGKRAGTYKVVSEEPVRAAAGERLTTLFLPSMGPRMFRVREDTDLRNKSANYAPAILGNPLSFQQAHAEMGALDAEVLEGRRRAAEAAVLQSRSGPNPEAYQGKYRSE